MPYNDGPADHCSVEPKVEDDGLPKLNKLVPYRRPLSNP